MSENTTVSKVTISKENADKLIGSIRENLKVVSKGYLTIAPDLAKLYDTKAYDVLGFKNFDDLCDNMFDMSHGTTVGIRKVFALYGTKKDGNYSIPQKYLDYGYSKLLYFATDDKKFKSANIDPFVAFTPDMTLAQMKSTLTNALIAKAKEQDENAIDTTAEEMSKNDNSTEEVTAEEMSNNDNSTEEATAEEMTFNDWAKNPKAYIDYILKDMEALKSIVSDIVKPEKLVYMDGAIDYMKSLKKAIK